jgi:hypothetical protein
MIERIRAKKPSDRTLGETMLIVLLTGGMWALCVGMGCVGGLGAIVAAADRRDTAVWLMMMLGAVLCGVIAFAVQRYMEEGAE